MCRLRPCVGIYRHCFKNRHVLITSICRCLLILHHSHNCNSEVICVRACVRACGVCGWCLSIWLGVSVCLPFYLCLWVWSVWSGLDWSNAGRCGAVVLGVVVVSLGLSLCVRAFVYVRARVCCIRTWEKRGCRE